jgi:8-oxo-dGTP diphosphatase
MSDKVRPKVGIGLLLVKDGKVLMGQRKGSHGAGEYGGTGGHLELGESFEACALRELAEEAGPHIKVKNVQFLCLTNITRYAPKHYVDIGMVAEWVSGEPKTMEPDKLVGWDWYDMDNLPQPLFATELGYVQAYRTGQRYFEEAQS